MKSIKLLNEEALEYVYSQFLTFKEGVITSTYSLGRILGISGDAFFNEYTIPTLVKDEFIKNSCFLKGRNKGYYAEVEKSLMDYLSIYIEDRKGLHPIPSVVAFELWYEFASNENEYKSFCRKSFGRVIEINDKTRPSTGDNMDAFDKTFLKMDRYEIFSLDRKLNAEKGREFAHNRFIILLDNYTSDSLMKDDKKYIPDSNFDLTSSGNSHTSSKISNSDHGSHYVPGSSLHSSGSSSSSDYSSGSSDS